MEWSSECISEGSGDRKYTRSFLVEIERIFPPRCRDKHRIAMLLSDRTNRMKRLDLLLICYIFDNADSEKYRLHMPKYRLPIGYSVHEFVVRNKSNIVST